MPIVTTTTFDIHGFAGDDPAGDDWEQTDHLPYVMSCATEAEAKAAMLAIESVAINFISDFYHYEIVAPGTLPKRFCDVACFVDAFPDTEET